MKLFFFIDNLTHASALIDDDLGRISKTKLDKTVGLSQFKWDLEKKVRTKRSLM